MKVEKRVTMKREYKYGNEIINYTIQRKKVKSITLKIKHSEEVIIIAPLNTTEIFLESIVKKRATWILSKLNLYKDINSNRSQKVYENGFSHRYLGRNYRLKFFENSDKDLVRYYRGYIEIYINGNSSEDKVKELLEKWYLERSKEKFTEVFEREFLKFEGYKIEKPRLRIKKLKSKWGSYTPATNSVLLNSELIKTSLACLEYVIVHELVHAIHPDHSKRFYGTLATILPDWEDRKKMLEKEGINIL